MPRDLRDQKPNKTYNRMSQPQVSHHQARFNEGLNKRYFTKLCKSISISPRIHSRSRPECNIDGTGKYPVQIPGDDGC